MSIEEIKKELLSSAVERKRTGHLQPGVTDRPLPNLHKASLLSEEAVAATIYPVILNSQEDSGSFKPIDCFEDDIVGQSNSYATFPIVHFNDEIRSSRLPEKVRRIFEREGLLTFGEVLSSNWMNLKGMGSKRISEFEHFVSVSTKEIDALPSAIPFPLFSIVGVTFPHNNFAWDAFGFLRQTYIGANDSVLSDAINYFEGPAVPSDERALSNLAFLSGSDLKYLKYAGIRNIGDLISLTEDEFMQIRGMGTERLHRVKNGLALIGVGFRPNSTHATVEYNQIFSEYARDAVKTLRATLNDRSAKNIPEKTFSAWLLPSLESMGEAPSCPNVFLRQLYEVENWLLQFNKKKKFGTLSVEEWIESLPDRNCAKVLEARFKGKTLEECSNDFGVTRQRAQQIVSREMKRRPPLVEDCFLPVFDKYRISEKEAAEIFGIEGLAFFYLAEASTTPKYKKSDIHEALGDLEIQSSHRSLIASFLDKQLLSVGTIRVKPTRSDILKAIVMQYATSQTRADVLLDVYWSTLNNNNLSNEKGLKISTKANLIGLLRRTDYAVMSQGESIRFYEHDANSLKELIHEVRLYDYSKQEISTNLIFEKNSDVMEEFGILDEYELHFLIRKASTLGAIVGHKVIFKRSPMLEIDCESARKSQIERLLEELSPIEVKAFAEEYERRYGVKRDSFLGGWVKQLSYLIVNGEFVWSRQKLQRNDKDLITKALASGYCSISDLKDILYAEGGEEASRKCTAYSLREAGFVVDEQCAFPPGTDPESFFRCLLLNPVAVSTASLGESITSNSTFRSELTRLTRSYEIIEIADGCYVRISELPMNANDCSSYCDAVFDFTEENKPFTVDGLRKSGFDCGIGTMPFNEFIYTGILSADTGGRIRRTAMGGKTIFSKRSGNFTFTDVLEWEISNSKQRTIPELCDTLNREYGISVLPCLVRSYLSRAGLYKYEWDDVLQWDPEKTND